MITNVHEMAGLVGSMDGCYGFDSRIPIAFPAPNTGKSKIKEPMTVAANVPQAAVRMEHYVVNEQGEYFDLFSDSR